MRSSVAIDPEPEQQMLINVTPAGAKAELADYLRRLGCTVEPHGLGRLSAFVTYPETVDDEPACLREWCESWRRPGRRAVVVDQAVPALR